MTARSIRIGAGAGFSGDRIEPAIDLAERGKLDYLVFECLAERTIAKAVARRSRDERLGYDPLLDERMRAVLPAARRNGVRVISNMGAANPLGAAKRVCEIAGELGLGPLKVAAVVGDDVLPQIREVADIAPIRDQLLSANAYLGCEALVEALDAGADVVLTGRVADPSLFLAPMVHEFGWALDDWDLLGQGTVIGHLLECAGQLTGGYFADPGLKDIPDLANLGFPLADVSADGSAVLTKLPGTGGQLSLATCKEQLLYELHDPTRYLTPDVCADFSGVRATQIAEDKVRVSGGRGQPRPQTLKIAVGYHAGYHGEGQISYAGLGAEARGRLALEIVEARLKRLGAEVEELRLDLIGVNAITEDRAAGPEGLREVRARVTARTSTLTAAQWVGREVEALYTNGPAGGGGAWQFAEPIVAIAPAYLARNQVRPAILWETTP